MMEVIKNPSSIIAIFLMIFLGPYFFLQTWVLLSSYQLWVSTPSHVLVNGGGFCLFGHLLAAEIEVHDIMYKKSPRRLSSLFSPYCSVLHYKPSKQKAKFAGRAPRRDRACISHGDLPPVKPFSALGSIFWY